MPRISLEQLNLLLSRLPNGFGELFEASPEARRRAMHLQFPELAFALRVNGLSHEKVQPSGL